MEERLIPESNHPIRLTVFEGPLDLLLYLIRKNEIDIYDIPISTVTDQYLDILHQMETLNLEIAGDFFVMAATLMYIKSRMLLPKKDQTPEIESDEESDIDPRWELVQQLLEYRKFKEASFELQTLIERAHDLIPRDMGKTAPIPEERPLKPSDRVELWNTFNQVLRRLTERMVVGEIHDEVVTVADRMEYIIDRLKTEKTFTFTSLLNEKPTVYAVVATFLALLELARLKQIDVRQDDSFSEIQCERLDEADLQLDTVNLEE